ncbi:MAG: DUF92 domain-containing protein [Fidelibacterota bacterium]
MCRLESRESIKLSPATGGIVVAQFFFPRIRTTFILGIVFPVIHFFSNPWITFLVFLALILGLLGLTELMRRKGKWSPEGTRKFLHLVVGILVILCPFLFDSRIPPATLAVIFILINGAALKTRTLKGMHGTGRRTYGTVYFPVAFLILTLFWWERPITLVTSLLLLTFADTTAAVVGERAKSPDRYVAWSDEKSVQGTLTMFLVSLLLVGGGVPVLYRLAGLTPPGVETVVPLSLFIAALATIAEGMSHAGSDNLTVPLVAAVGIDLFQANAQSGHPLGLLFWAVFSLVLAWSAFRLNALTIDGALGAFVMGVFIFGIGTWKFMIPLTVFLVISSLLSRIHYRAKAKLEVEWLGKGYPRNLVQVFANGGVPLVIAIWWFYSPSPWLYVAYVASVAAANADTWATEIGLLSKSSPRNCVTFRVVEPGTSGGVTPLGTFGAAAGSTVVALSALPFLPPHTQAAVLVAAAGFAASLIDSILGATLQATYRCRTCQKTTEMPRHCSGEAILVKGHRTVTNNTVNLVCTLSGGVMILLLPVLPTTG